MRWETQAYTHIKNNRQLAAIVVLLSIIGILAILIQPSDAGRAVIFSDEYTQHTVNHGETLWSIARHYRPETDPRDVIYEMQEVNGITPLIHPGQTIWVPVGGN